MCKWHFQVGKNLQLWKAPRELENENIVCEPLTNAVLAYILYCSCVVCCCVHRPRIERAHKVRLSPWGEYQDQHSATHSVHHNIGGRVRLKDGWANNTLLPYCRWCAALNMYFSTLQYNLLHKFWKLKYFLYIHIYDATSIRGYSRAYLSLSKLLCIMLGSCIMEM